jgi:hypothetical protein
MIDWLQVLYHACWVIGLAVILTALSHHDFLAAHRGVRLRSLLAGPSFQIPLSGGSFLIALGLAFLARSWWERLIWLGFAALFIFQGWRTFSEARDSPWRGEAEDENYGNL